MSLFSKKCLFSFSNKISVHFINTCVDVLYTCDTDEMDPSNIPIDF